MKTTPLKQYYSVKTRSFRNGSLLVRISLVTYEYVPKYTCTFVMNTCKIRIRIHVQKLYSCKKSFSKFKEESKSLGLFWDLACLL